MSTNQTPAYIMQKGKITIVYGNQPYYVTDTNRFYNKIVECLKEQKWDEIIGYLDPSKGIETYSNGKLVVKSGVVFYDGEELHNSLTDRIISLMDQGFDFTPLYNFLSNVMENPSNRAVRELYSFLENNSLPITPDGHFLAYKRVSETFKDIRTGTIDNSVGQRPKMDRNKVDDDPLRTCSHGLHVCSMEYLEKSGYGDGNGSKIVICKVHPKDVVAVPNDYRNSKMRCCEYEVIGVLEDGIARIAHER